MCGILCCWCLKHIRTIAAMYVSSTTIRTYVETVKWVYSHREKIHMVGGYIEDLEKPWNFKNWWVGTCMEMGPVHNWDNTLHKIILFAIVNWCRYTFCL